MTTPDTLRISVEWTTPSGDLMEMGETIPLNRRKGSAIGSMRAIRRILGFIAHQFHTARKR